MQMIDTRTNSDSKFYKKRWT